MSSMPRIHTLFGEEEFWVVADSQEFLDECSHQGLNTAHIHELSALPRHSIIFSFSNNAAKLTLEIAKATPVKKSVFCAAQVFDPSFSSANYSLHLLLNSDFRRALERQRFFLNMLNSYDSFLLSGEDTSGKVTLNRQAEPYALIEEDISESFIHSAAEFFEVHYAHMNTHERCPFCLNGKLKISGILTVLRKANPQLPEDIRARLKLLSESIAKAGGWLTVVENKVTSLQVDNEEHIETLKSAAGVRGLGLTEFAIGVNEEITAFIDYKVNSQMNEGISGVHLAIGDGSSGFHIDFLSPDVNVTPVV
ncbi:hypothetical protein [Pseudomonas sp. SWRI179]|uniref:hypothetical protein n=1 Tax=Pseudomonas sp. SWRI179 TaxID=2745497 RepID=UPI001647A3D1|nr:hypothetical protein [Pseudomonas sp. SWRI179]MBC3385870.1 hypothetical protein [Pseudomonas sp. SWRI179]